MTKEESHEIFGSDFTSDKAQEELDKRAELKEKYNSKHYEITLEDYLLWLALSRALKEESLLYCREIDSFIGVDGFPARKYTQKELCQFEFEKISLRVFSRKEFPYDAFYEAKEFADDLKSHLQRVKEGYFEDIERAKKYYKEHPNSWT